MVCLVCFSGIESVFWCAVQVIPALMWVCNSSIGSGVAILRRLSGGLSCLYLRLCSTYGSGLVSSFSLSVSVRISFGEASMW
ncbi:unnamed protein product [Brassica oleracea var. botrytis]